MLGLKSTLLASLLGITASLALAFLWKSEQVKNATLTGELTQAMANTQTLKDAIASQNKSVEAMRELAKSNQEEINELNRQIQQSQNETRQMQARINALRAAEADRALQAPYERGNAARGRFTCSMQRIAGAEDRDCSGSDSADPATGSNNATANGT